MRIQALNFLNERGISTMAGKFVLKKATNGEFYFQLKATNGETILSSERYAAKPSAEGGIASVKTNAPIDEHYERKTNKNNQPMFNLKASNGQVVGTSESYSSESAREAGIASVKTTAPDATTDDQT
jgi:uncharacterized protein YegP (UPF0339 family)